MAQRWMQAKKLIARKHGAAKSGAGRATGPVKEDINIGWVDAHTPGTPRKLNCKGVVFKAKADRPKPWTYSGSDPYTC